MTEMDKLIAMMMLSGIPCDIRPHPAYPSTKMMCYPAFEGEKRICDAVCFPGSYGGHHGLLEIMGLVDTEKVGDYVEGYLTANDIFYRILGHWLETKEEKE